MAIDKATIMGSSFIFFRQLGKPISYPFLRTFKVVQVIILFMFCRFFYYLKFHSKFHVKSSSIDTSVNLALAAAIEAQIGTPEEDALGASLEEICKVVPVPLSDLYRIKVNKTLRNIIVEVANGGYKITHKVLNITKEPTSRLMC